MSIGPIQIIAFGFERTDQFRGEVLEELTNLRGRGLIRLIDLFVAIKDPSGELIAAEMNDLTQEETVEFGQVIGKLLGLDGVETSELAADAIEKTLSAVTHSVGLDYKGIQRVVEKLPPGKAFAVLMFEHTWAIPLRDAIRRAGGFPLAQGFLTQEALTMVGAELQAMAEAEQAIEVAEIIKSAAILDTLVTLQEAEAIKTAIAADVLRTLAIAEVIEEAAVQEAIETLAVAGLLEEKYLKPAVEAEAARADEDKEIFAEVEQ
jgi:uncharacterized membrane protein